MLSKFLVLLFSPLPPLPSLPNIIAEAIAFINDGFTSKDYNELYRLQNQFHDLRYQVTVI